jgi:hypothetical protein
LIKHPVKQHQLVLIGDMTVSFALLENNLQQLAWLLIAQGQRIGQIITAELSFRSLRALVLNLYLERYGKDSDYLTLKGFIEKAVTFEDRRNQITHSIWGVGNDDQSILRIKTTAKEKTGLRYQFEDVQAKDLENFVSEIKQLVSEIQFFWVHLITNSKEIYTPVIYDDNLEKNP